MSVAISAHRGGPGAGGGHSTWATYEAAVTSGAEYAEFDIRRTQDGVYIAHHDAHLSVGPATARPSGDSATAHPSDGPATARRARGPAIADLTYAEVCEFLGFEVPRIDELMTFLGGKLKGHLDVKEPGYEAEIVDMALAAFGPDDFVATGIEDAAIPAIKAAHPEVVVGLSLGRNRVPALNELFPIARIRACGADWVAVRHDIARMNALRACARHGIGVMVWTVDEPALMDLFLADPRVDVLISNLPAEAVARRRNLP
ncbi:glycerophosphodiester phosphodiesterase [Nonomuraea phyllanthi]|uniref:Glycerophosphodiester phosphodiesterase n=1 Tax=Nonomuraea phyllanthi TaxID=2219224 RepID=A0A5C4WQH0_9ACTN|nr:glycerophosphodiester phosphodiesterase family protein [Nonomuraea phyllanthi]KAB8195776.1 glycerophosphodiester phosphodiesterase [Nonomuraea phyllanthi]